MQGSWLAEQDYDFLPSNAPHLVENMVEREAKLPVLAFEQAIGTSKEKKTGVNDINQGLADGIDDKRSNMSLKSFLFNTGKMI